MSPSLVSDQSASAAITTKSPYQASNGTLRRTLTVPLPNPSLQVTADHNLKQENAPVYAPNRGEVLLHIKATGVCGYVILYARETHL